MGGAARPFADEERDRRGGAPAPPASGASPLFSDPRDRRAPPPPASDKRPSLLVLVDRSSGTRLPTEDLSDCVSSSSSCIPCDARGGWRDSVSFRPPPRSRMCWIDFMV